MRPDLPNPSTVEAANAERERLFRDMQSQRDEALTMLSEARIRLDQHLGMCACPGEACVSACSVCNTTQDLVNRIRAFMQGRMT